MTVEQKRMYQRRGLKQDLPEVPDNGEILLTLDSEEVYIGVNGGLLKLITPNDVVNDLSTDVNLPLSAKQGIILKGKVDSLENFLNLYKQQIDEIIEKNTGLLVKGNNPPSADIMWYDTSD